MNTLVQRLKDAGGLDNALILYIADVGGNAESDPDGIADGPGALHASSSE